MRISTKSLYVSIQSSRLTGQIKHAGVKVLEKVNHQTLEASYRLSQDGVDVLLPLLGDQRKVNISKSDLEKLLAEENPLFEVFVRSHTV